MLCGSGCCEGDQSRKCQTWTGCRKYSDSLSDVNVPDTCSPTFDHVRGFPMYSTAPDQSLMGVPLREGSMWHLSSEERFEAVCFSLYVNGFAFTSPDGGETSVSLSPFSMVRNCRFSSGAYSKLKSFKVSLMDEEPCPYTYFAVQSTNERESDEERSEWVLGISHTILLITDSLLPPFSVTCDPLRNVPQTLRRLMAGYLVHRDEEDFGTISVLFCELQAHCGDSARFVMYENELCIKPVIKLRITDTSACHDINAINCCCFLIDNHHFASQTPSERKLWLRALSNVKVKIQNHSPSPTEEELSHFREGIREQIQAVKAMVGSRINSRPLLRRVVAPRSSDLHHDVRSSADETHSTSSQFVIPQSRLSL